MDGFDLVAVRLVRLQQDLDALLPHDDPGVRQVIFHLLSIGVRDGLDLLPRFRDALRGFPECRPCSAEPVDGAGLEMEALGTPHRATLWPYRPKRRPDELLSSWLWRIARGLGAPPKRFAIDAIGTCLGDVDRDIDDAAIARLAFFSGQSEEHLLRGTMRADAPIRSTDFRERVQRALLRHGDLVLNRSRRGRSVPVIQYCPVCLGGDDTAYLRRGWRFSVEIVCHRDGCLLLDSCWRCGALLNPLAQTVPSSEFLCVKCSAPLARAPSLCLDQTTHDQVLVYHQLERLAFSISPDVIGILAEEYIDELSASDLRGTNPANPADRHNAIMEEGWRLYGAWEQARAARAAERRARVKRRKAATESAATVAQTGASSS